MELSQATPGTRFKVIGFTDGITGKPDVIQKVENGIVYGEFTEAKVEDCRTINPQPEHLKKQKDEKE